MLSNAIQLGERMMNQGKFEPVSSDSSGNFIDVKLDKSPFDKPSISKDSELVSTNLGSVGILVVKDGKFLCGTRHNDFGYGLMCGPGGHIEKGETPEYAAIREADEEFSIIPTELISLGTGPTEPDTGLTPHLFLCTEFEGEPASGDLEITNIKFRSLDELENVDMFQPFIDGIYQFLDSLVDNGEKNLASETNISEKPIDKYANSAIIKSKNNSDGGKGSGNHGHKGMPGRVGGSLPSGKAEDLKKALNSGKISLKLDTKKQSGHTKGSTQYNKCVSQGRKMSVVTISNEEVAELIEQYSGKGHVYTNGIQFKESFTHTSKIGIFLDKKGNEAETTRGTIHYSSTGAHLVPAKPKKGG